jgi:hypothetical protein
MSNNPTDSILGLDKNFCSTLGFEQNFLFKPEKFVCDELGFIGFELSNPRVGLTSLPDPRVGFELLSETQFYGQASHYTFRACSKFNKFIRSNEIASLRTINFANT